MTNHAVTHYHPNYVAVWYWLTGLVLVSVLISALSFSHTFTLVSIFSAAFVKALLVGLYYMHLRFERLLIYSLVLVPVVFFIILLLVLLPDIAMHQ